MFPVTLLFLAMIVLTTGSSYNVVGKHARNSTLSDDHSVQVETLDAKRNRDHDNTLGSTKEDQTASNTGAILMDSGGVCPNWMYPEDDNGSTTCVCGSDLGRVITCDNKIHKVTVVGCYSMTYSNDDNTTLIVGKSLYTCPLGTYTVPPNVSNLCHPFYRDGQLCGKCIDGFAPPVYSYSPDCANCTEYSNNWVKYMAISFLPLTALFLLVVIFHITITSALLNVLVVVCQILSSPFVSYQIAVGLYNIPKPDKIGAQILFSLYGISNLDFFRFLFPLFCLHPNTTTLQTLALDYTIAVYPLFLIAVTYLLVEMHDHNCRILVWLWKPLHASFVGFRREWNIKGSLINAFATFLLLSYVKFLSTSFSLLIPVQVFTIHGKALNKLYLYFDGTVEYFGQEHLPFALLALVVLVVFNLFPLILLVLYPCQCFQRCLNYYNIRCQVLHTFMDVFHGCYKDGSNGTRDCRWFAALYLLLRIASLVIVITFPSTFVLCPLTLLFMIPVFLTAVFHPHKSPLYNFADIFLLLILISGGVVLQSQSAAKERNALRTAKTLSTTIGFIPLLYFVIILLYKLLPQRFKQKFCLLIPFYHHKLPHNCEEPLPWPDRTLNAEHYAPLLSP